MANLQACGDADIEACLGEEVRPDPGDDACGQACLALFDCELGLPGANETTLGVLDCAAACRGADEALDEDRAACINLLEGCDGAAFEACLGGGDPGNDECANGCKVLDECGLAVSNAADESLTTIACAESCRAGTDLGVANAQCLIALDGCDEAAIEECLSSSEPSIGDDLCAAACTRLDTCELCLPNAEDECYEPAACAEACRQGEVNATAAQCLADLDACEEDPINACLALEPVEPVAPDCAVYCQRFVECAALPEAEQAAALEACGTQCTTDNNPELRQCYVDAADCDAAAACTPAP